MHDYAKTREQDGKIVRVVSVPTVVAASAVNWEFMSVHESRLRMRVT